MTSRVSHSKDALPPAPNPSRPTISSLSLRPVSHWLRHLLLGFRSPSEDVHLPSYTLALYTRWSWPGDRRCVAWSGFKLIYCGLLSHNACASRRHGRSNAPLASFVPPLLHYSVSHLSGYPRSRRGPLMTRRSCGYYWCLSARCAHALAWYTATLHVRSLRIWMYFYVHAVYTGMQISFGVCIWSPQQDE